MKSWKIVKPKEFSLSSANDTVVDAKSAKIKILRAGISNTDLHVYNGDIKGAAYPIIPSRQAVGIVSEVMEETGYQKSERVFLSPYLKCGQCIPCLEDEPQMCENLKVFGLDTDGFLADFCIVPVDILYRLPEAVDKDKAMFIEYIAIAKTALEKLKVEKGEHIAIVGANKLGNVLAQLAIYYQSVPILIDDNAELLEHARQNGVYHTVHTKKHDAKKAVKEITGNRMAENVIHIACANQSFEHSLELCGYNGRVGLLSGHTSDFECNIKTLLERQLHVVSINNGYDNIPTAINLLANKIITVQNLLQENIAFAEIPEKFATLCKHKVAQFQITVDC